MGAGGEIWRGVGEGMQMKCRWRGTYGRVQVKGCRWRVQVGVQVEKCRWRGASGGFEGGGVQMEG